jgi:antitoxin component YwqK of YwqJK toxin-antitoxin module
MRILILFFIVLGSVCHAELRTWTAVNGKEVEAEFVSNEKGIVKLKLKSGKVFEVPANKLSKKDNEFISSLAKPEGVNGDELEFREGIIYLKDSEIPYTGKFYALYPSGKREQEAHYKNGKIDGFAERWYENGQKKSEGNFKIGKRDGLSLQWHENGKKAVEGNFKDGKQDGLETSWYEDGQKRSEDNFKDGKKDGRSIFWFPNGQKGNEGIYKDGITEGIHKMWHENGQMRVESKFENGKGSAKFWNSKGESVNSFEETGLK